MKQRIISKTISQLLMALAVAILYMQIRPVQEYTLKWPLTFLAVWFLWWAWVAYLRLDRLSIFEVTDRYKKQNEEAQAKYEMSYFRGKNPNFLNFIFTPITKEEQNNETLKVRLFSNAACFVILLILSFIF